MASHKVFEEEVRAQENISEDIDMDSSITEE